MKVSNKLFSFKKFIAVGLSCVMFLQCSSLSFASDLKHITLNQRNQMLINYLASNNCNENNISEKVSDFLKNNDFELLNLSNTNNNDSNNKVHILNKIDLNESTQIKFYSDGTLSINTLSVKPINNVNTIKNGASYKFVSASAERKGLFGQTLYKLHVENNFGYDGSKAWDAGGLNAYHENGCCTIWQVSNWEKGTTIINDGEYCRAYANGNFHWGFEYEKIGVVIQDVFEDLRVSVTKNGDVYKSGE